jgi:hypothetical protein
MRNGFRIAVTFTGNGSKVTPLLYKSSVPTTACLQLFVFLTRKTVINFHHGGSRAKLITIAVWKDLSLTV